MYITLTNIGICISATGLFCLNFYPAKCKRLLLNVAMLYCKVEVRIHKVYKYLYKHFEHLYKYDVFYYKDNVQVGKCILTNLVRNVKDTNCSDYNYVVYKQPSITPNEYKCRLFDTQKALLETFYNNGTIICEPCSKSIISACVVTKDSEHNSFSTDVTPRHLGIEIVRNKIYTEKFIKCFFNLDLPLEYTVYIIDSDINQHTLVNNAKQKQYLEITPKGFNIITKNNTSFQEDEKYTDNFFVIRPYNECIR